jgi:hypothetical protein
VETVLNATTVTECVLTTLLSSLVLENALNSIMITAKAAAYALKNALAGRSRWSLRKFNRYYTQIT